MVDDVDGQLGHGEPVRSGLSGMFIEGLPVDGASISVVGESGIHSVVSSSGGAAAVLERLQFGLGEGPHWDVLAAGKPVLVGDLRSSSVEHWPTFAAEATSLNIGAMFSFPMKLGTAIVGVVDLCRYQPGELSAAEVQEAVTLTRAVTRAAVHVATDAANTEVDAGPLNPIGPYPEMRREVHQATGMLAVQLGATTSTTDAFATLRAFAFAHDRPVDDVASDIVNRRLDLSEPVP